jgi:hypothetical protein
MWKYSQDFKVKVVELLVGVVVDRREDGLWRGCG